MMTRLALGVLAVLIGCPASLACTIFAAADGDVVLVGNNEDFYPPGPKIWVQPAVDGKYGWIGFGFEKDYPRFPQGGVNDQGLFFDWASMPNPRTDVQFPADKPFFNRYSPVQMLEECATVDEAIALYSKYNERIFRRSHIMIADRHGDSAIIEWGKSEMAVIRKTGRYQVLTNFNITDPQLAGGYPCRRYKTADEMLAQGEVSVEHFAAILRAVHQRGRFRTQYSNVYDLKNGLIYVYRDHYFQEQVTIDVAKELSKPVHSYELRSLFARTELLAPTDGQQVSPTDVTFRWRGLATEYSLLCSTDAEFAGCRPVRVVGPPPGAGDAGKPVTLLDKSASEVAVKVEITKSLESLDPGETYYWKVVTNGPDGIAGQSVVRTFTVGD